MLPVAAKRLLVPLVLLNLGLVVLAIYLVVRALRRLHHYDRLILDFKQKHEQLQKLLA